MGSLLNKKALVTGGEQGIGRAAVEELLRNGCDVFVHYFVGEDSCKEIVQYADSLGRKCNYAQADLTDTLCFHKVPQFLTDPFDVVFDGFFRFDLERQMHAPLEVQAEVYLLVRPHSGCYRRQ